MVVSNLVNPIVPTGGTGLADHVQPAAVTTTDATVTDAIAVAMAAGQTMTIRAQITGRNTNGLSVGYTISATFKRDSGGNVTIVGQQLNEAVHFDDGAAWTAALVADTATQSVDVRVTGEIGVTINWNIKVNYSLQAA